MAQVRTVEAAEVEHLAEGMLAGPIQLDIPPGRVTQRGQCTFQHDSTLIAVAPHMHQTGVHLKAIAHSSMDGEVVLYDRPYDFGEQLHYEVDFVRVRAGDVLRVECTYQNDTGRMVTFGDSSTQEMCFAGIVHYPAQDSGSCYCFD